MVFMLQKMILQLEITWIHTFGSLQFILISGIQFGCKRKELINYIYFPLIGQISGIVQRKGLFCHQDKNNKSRRFMIKMCKKQQMELL